MAQERRPVEFLFPLFAFRVIVLRVNSLESNLFKGKIKIRDWVRQSSSLFFRRQDCPHEHVPHFGQKPRLGDEKIIEDILAVSTVRGVRSISVLE